MAEWLSAEASLSWNWFYLVPEAMEMPPPNLNSTAPADVDDPLGSVAASQVDGDEESEESGREDQQNQQHAQASPDKRSSPHVLDPTINLSLTPQGIRSLLGRPQVSRPKPLLKIFLQRLWKKHT